MDTAVSDISLYIKFSLRMLKTQTDSLDAPSWKVQLFRCSMPHHSWRLWKIL